MLSLFNRGLLKLLETYSLIRTRPRADNRHFLADAADCWVAIGPTPNSSIAADGTGEARKLKASVPYQFHVAAGHKVAVEAA